MYFTLPYRIKRGWVQENVNELYLVLRVSCWQTENHLSKDSSYYKIYSLLGTFEGTFDL